ILPRWIKSAILRQPFELKLPVPSDSKIIRLDIFFLRRIPVPFVLFVYSVLGQTAEGDTSEFWLHLLYQRDNFLLRLQHGNPRRWIPDRGQRVFLLPHECFAGGELGRIEALPPHEREAVIRFCAQVDILAPAIDIASLFT